MNEITGGSCTLEGAKVLAEVANIASTGGRGVKVLVCYEQTGLNSYEYTVESTNLSPKPESGEWEQYDALKADLQSASSIRVLKNGAESYNGSYDATQNKILYESDYGTEMLAYVYDTWAFVESNNSVSRYLVSEALE